MADGKLTIEVDADVRDFKKSLENLGRTATASTGSLAAQAAKLSAEYRKAGMTQSESMKKAWSEIERTAKTSSSGISVNLNAISAVAKLTAQAIAAIGAALVAGLGVATKMGIEFEQQMSAVRAISGATAQDMAVLTAKAKEMGIVSAFSATEAGKAFEYMAMAGWKTEQMTAGVEGIMNLAAAAGENLGVTADIVTDSLTAFGLSAKNAAQFSDVLAAAASNSNTSVTGMGNSFKYAAPLAGAMKFSVQDVALAMGLMANAGVKGEQAGTALRSVFTRLAKPPKEAAEAIKFLGLSVTDSSGRMKPLRDIIDDMRKSFSTLSDQQKATYATMLGGQEAISGLLAIVNAGQADFDKLSLGINNSAGAAERMANIRLDNVRGQFTLLGSSIEGVGLSIFDAFAAPMKEAVKSSIDGVNALNKSLSGNEFQEALGRIGKAIGTVFQALTSFLTTALPAAVSAMASVLRNIDSIIIAVGALAGALFAFKGAAIIMAFVTAIRSGTVAINIMKAAQIALNVAMASNPFGILVVGLGALTGAIITAWEVSEDFRKAVITTWYSIKTSILESINAILSGVNKLLSVRQYFGGEDAPVFELFKIDSPEETAEKVSDAIKSARNRVDAEKPIEIGYDFVGPPLPPLAGEAGAGGGGDVDPRGEKKSKAKQLADVIREVTLEVAKLTGNFADVARLETEAKMSEIAKAIKEVGLSGNQAKEATESLQKSLATAMESSRIQELSRAVKDADFEILRMAGDAKAIEDAEFQRKIEGMSESLRKLIPDAEEAADAISGLVARMKLADKEGKARKELETALGTFGGSLSTAITRTFENAAKDGETNMKDIMNNLGRNVLGALGESMMKISTDYLTEALKSIGKDIMLGLKDGMSGQLSGIFDFLKEVGMKMISFLSGILGIASPSKEFAKLGAFTMQGLRVGIERSSNDVLEAISGIGDAMLATYSGLKPEITPVLSMPSVSNMRGAFAIDMIPQMAYAGAMAQPVSVNVVNRYDPAATRVETKETRKSNGSVDIENVIVSIVSQNVDAGGDVWDAIENRNESRRGIRR